MTTIEDLKQKYADYLAAVEELEQKASLTAGLMGFGTSPKNHPCHEAFYQEVAAWVEEFLSENPSPQEVSQAAFWILQAAHPHEDNTTVFWILYAVHGHAAPLIPLMTPEDRRELAAWYDKYHPRFSRLPVQKKIGKLLRS